MQRLEKCHQRSGLRRTQGFSVGGHVAATLNHLPDELILRELDGDTIERRPALSPDASQCVAVVALLGLKNQRTMALQGRASFQIIRWNRIAAPSIHHWTPWCI